VEAQILYEGKTEYLQLIQQYLDERILPSEFRNEYLEMAEKSMKKTDSISD